jgi:formylglycine-generating enzyme required for sulfatase activity
MKRQVAPFVAVLFAGCGDLEIGSYGLSEGTGANSADDLSKVGGGSRAASGGSAGSTDTGGSGGRPDTGGTGGGDTGGTGGGPDSGGSGGSTDTGGSGGGPDSGGSGGSSGTAGGNGTFAGNLLDQSCGGINTECGGWPGCCGWTTVGSAQFELGEPGSTWTASASVSGFYPDLFEATVARFARFVAAFDAWRAAGNPRAGDGEHPYIRDTGWRSEWKLAATAAGLEELVSSCLGNATYPLRENSPEVPMNCVNWQEAFAFCIWDGKRLLTEAEYELAAKNGAENWRYPWGSEEPTFEHAVYGCTGDGTCGPTDIPPVGSKRKGDSNDGLHDLAGSIGEWVFDSFSDLYPNPCIDCASTAESEFRGFRGGDWISPGRLESWARNMTKSESRTGNWGIRCATSAR